MLDIQRNDYDIIEVEIGNEPKFQEPCMHGHMHTILLYLRGLRIKYIRDQYNHESENYNKSRNSIAMG